MTQPSVTKDDILQASQGMLQKQFYVVLTKPVAGMDAIMSNLEAHLAFQVELEASGHMVAAGPFWADDEKTWLGEGMIILRAESLAEARQIAARDPMHASGARTFEVRPWLLNEGTITVTLSFSKRSGQLS